MERQVVIYVSQEFRAKVKVLKKEKTYEEFLDNLLNKKDALVKKDQSNTTQPPRRKVSK